jgi:c-di-GMP-binding flagellar brake protein YcgR
VKERLKELADLNTYVDIARDGMCLARRRRLVHGPDDTDEVWIVLGGEEIGEGEVSISFVVKKGVYEFRTSVIATDAKDEVGRILRLGIPRIIVRTDRRGPYRVIPDEDKPIGVRLKLADSETILTTAIDVSETGISFPLPHPVDFFSLGEQCTMDLDLPDGFRLTVRGEVKNRRPFGDVSRFGVQFIDFTDSDRIAVSRYVRMQELERRKPGSTVNEAPRPSIAIVTRRENMERYGPLKHHYPIRRVDPRGAIPNLAEHKPRLAIIDCGPLERDLLVEAIGTHKNLSQLSLLVVSDGMPSPVLNGRAAFITPETPIQILTDLVGQMVDIAAKGKEIRKGWEKVSGTGRGIVVLDKTGSFGSNCAYFLKSRQFKVTVVDTIVDLIGEINRKCPEILLLDEKPDKLTAAQMLTLFNSNAVLGPVPKILMTRDRQAARELKKKGLITSFVEKPLHPATVMNEITVALLDRIAKGAETVGNGDQQIETSN